MTFVVLTAEFAHESNTFSRNPTGYQAFAERSLHRGAQALAERGEANTPLAGFNDVARREGWEIVHTISASAQPGGPVTRDAFDRIAGEIVEGARANLDRLNGIALGLHGAMVTDFCQDGEGELLSRLRAAVGPDLPIAITLDPHANVTRAMCDLAQIVLGYKTYPHVDMREIGAQAAGILHRAMTGEIRPRTLRVHRPMLEEVNGGRTDIGPMVDRLAAARAYENEPGVFAVSVNGGFGNADIAEVGPTVLVTAHGDLARHRPFADTIADDIWNRRLDPITRFVPAAEVPAIAKAYVRRGGPLIIADYADNPGGGGYGDSTTLLRHLIEADVRDACFGTIFDPETAVLLHRHQVGDSVRIQLGGKTDPRIGGGPLDLTVTLKLKSDGAYVGDGPMAGGLRQSWGPTAVVQVGDIEIMVVSVRSQMLDLQQFRAFGIDPAAKTVVALKSMQHFRAAFEPIAGEVIVCDSGALCTPDLSQLPYVNVPRPIFPLDRDMAL